MTAFDYAGLRDSTVEPLLDEFGAAATLTQPGVSTGNEWDPTPGTPTTYAVILVPSRFTMAERQGTLVQEKDRVFIMSTKGDPDPDLNGTLTIDGETLQVVRIEPIKGALVTMIYRVFCRK